MEGLPSCPPVQLRGQYLGHGFMDFRWCLSVFRRKHLKNRNFNLRQAVEGVFKSHFAEKFDPSTPLAREYRIFGLEQLLAHRELSNFVEKSISIAEEYHDAKVDGTVMANVVYPGDVGSGGGWHQDSQFKKQLKVLCTLVMSIRLRWRIPALNL